MHDALDTRNIITYSLKFLSAFIYLLDLSPSSMRENCLFACIDSAIVSLSHRQG
jgi:hypothetical protein